MAGGLLEGVAELEEPRLVPGPSQQLEPDGDAVFREAGGEAEGGEPRVRGQPAGALVLLLFAERRRLLGDGRVGERVEPRVGHRPEERVPDLDALLLVLEVLAGLAGGDGLRLA